MEAAGSSKTLINIYHSERRYTSEGSNPHGRKNLKSHEGS
jgi:hypothetical protein